MFKLETIRKLEARSSNFETNSNIEVRKENPMEPLAKNGFRIPNFELVSSFGFRVSDFEFAVSTFHP